MVDAVVSVVLKNAQKLIQNEFALHSGVKDDVRKLSRTLQYIQTYVRDAEEKELKEEPVRSWLQKLKEAAFEVDDILDKYGTVVSQLEYKRRSMNKVCGFVFNLNPKDVAFRRSIAKKMKKAQGELDDIRRLRDNLGLQARNADSRDEVRLDRTTGSLVAEPVVYGRDRDEEKIVKCLVEDAANSDVLSVYPILGIGGLGKTTLAQMIFNNVTIKSRFEPRIWIRVPVASQQGGANVSEDFDIKALMRAIILSVSENKSEANLASLHQEIQELFKEKRYLLVLDDVWDLNIDKWNQLKNSLSCGSRGASVVITTCLENTANIMGTFSPHNLSGLNDDDCWLLFKQKAFKNDEEVSPHIEKIANEIVRKCNGVPLVAKTLGSLLQTTRSESKWENTRDTELWKLLEAEKSVWPMLRLSYWNLPVDIKLCFAFCAIFPKDYEIDAKQLIRLWRANGYISSTATLDVEDVGNQICNELVSRSLFQVEKIDGDNISSFKMHDLIHNLAQSVMQDESFIFDGKSSLEAEKKIRHMNLENCSKPASVLEDSQKVESLRTMLLRSEWKKGILSDVGCYDFSSFSKFPRARAVVARRLYSKALSSSIGNLIHLRHLDFSYSEIEVLPETICDLWNLETLDLTYCKRLQKLPNRTRCLENLWDLFLDGCESLESIPPRFGEIIGLKTLDFFVVGKHKDCGISELQDLNLKGKLHIEHLQRVRNLEDAQKANMRGKKKLHFLIFSWDQMSRDPCIDLQVLDVLKPHPNLEKMEIRAYNDTSLPLWMGNPIYKKLVSIKLSDLKNCLQLSSLGKLPSLKFLTLSQVKRIKYIDDVVYGEGTIIFPSLEELRIGGSKMLGRLLVVDEGDIFPRLTHMTIDDCPKLTLPRLPSVTALDATLSNSSLASVSNLRNLTELQITNDSTATSLPDEMFRNLSALQTLEIVGFLELDVLPNSMMNLTALKYLCIVRNTALVDFPPLGGLTSLQELEFLRCSKLRSLPTDIQNNTTLSSLVIAHCPELEKRCKKEDGEDWDKISHIPNVIFR